MQLCQHVLAHGTTTWEQLGARLGCPAALCALRWHVLWLEQFSATSAVKPQKVYSDWERCVLYTVSATIRLCAVSATCAQTHFSHCCADEASTGTPATLRTNDERSDLRALHLFPSAHAHPSLPCAVNGCRPCSPACTWTKTSAPAFKVCNST